jgi:cysteinyl-tRNA synthetase
MSKSSGEFLRLQLLIDKGYHPLAYRMMCLQAHYRSELEFSWEGLEAALTRYNRMVIGYAKWRERLPSAQIQDDCWERERVTRDLVKRFDYAISNDLNTAEALTVLEEMLALKKVAPECVVAAVDKLDTVLGLDIANPPPVVGSVQAVLPMLKLGSPTVQGTGSMEQPKSSRANLRIRPKSATITEAEITAALARRKAARAEKDFATSDAIRDELAAQGVEVMDGDPLEWEWKLGS